MKKVNLAKYPSELEEVPYDPMYEEGQGPQHEVPEEETEEREDFVVLDDASAEWCLKKISEKKAELEKWKNHYADQLARIQNETDRDIAFFEWKLEAYFRLQPHKVTKTQESYQLPSGKLVLKRQQPEFKRDDTLLIPWLKKNLPEFVKVEESADWANLKKATTISGNGIATDDGEIVPGVEVVARPDKFAVDLK